LFALVVVAACGGASPSRPDCRATSVPQRSAEHDAASGIAGTSAQRLWRSCFSGTTLELGPGAARWRCLALLDGRMAAAPVEAFERVVIRDGSEADLRRLRRLRGVRELTIAGRRPGALDAVTALRDLERLTIEDVEPGDLASLAALERLQYLRLGPLDTWRRYVRHLCPNLVVELAKPQSISVETGTPKWTPVERQQLMKFRPPCRDLSTLSAALPVLPRLDELVLVGRAGSAARPASLEGLERQPSLRILWVDASDGWVSLRRLERSRVTDLTVVRASLPSLAPLVGKRPALNKLTLQQMGELRCEGSPSREKGAARVTISAESCAQDLGLGELTELRYLDVAGLQLPSLSFVRRLHRLEHLAGVVVSWNPWAEGQDARQPGSRALRELVRHDHSCVLEVSHRREYADKRDPFCNWRPVCTPIEAPLCSKASLSIGDLVRAYQRTCPARCAQGCRVIHDCPSLHSIEPTGTAPAAGGGAPPSAPAASRTSPLAPPLRRR